MHRDILPSKLVCPLCRVGRSPEQTTLLNAESDLISAGWFDSRRQPGWSLLAAVSGKCQWACRFCIEMGKAIEGKPVLQTWCDYDPYFAFFDTEMKCQDCSQEFIFSAKEQQFWYEELKFYVQSRPKQCIECRRIKRAKRRNTLTQRENDS